MQTFLPYSDFYKSADVLDKKRCWKQVVEAKQIIQCLEGVKTGWKNHPAVKMWEGYEDALKLYYNSFLFVSIHKHKINTNQQPYDTALPISVHYFGSPWWLGNEDFHRAMRSRLIEKNSEFYLPLFPDDKGFNNGKYFWPVNETQKFKTI